MKESKKSIKTMVFLLVFLGFIFLSRIDIFGEEMGAIAQTVKLVGSSDYPDFIEVGESISISNISFNGNCINIGTESSCNNTGGIAMGTGSNSKADWSGALGYLALAEATDSWAIGQDAHTLPNAVKSLVIGQNSLANNSNCVVLGSDGECRGNSGISMGKNSVVNENASFGIAIGINSTSKAENCVAIGRNVVCDEQDMVKIGVDSIKLYADGNIVADNWNSSIFNWGSGYWHTQINQTAFSVHYLANPPGIRQHITLTHSGLSKNGQISYRTSSSGYHSFYDGGHWEEVMRIDRGQTYLNVPFKHKNVSRFRLQANFSDNIYVGTGIYVNNGTLTLTEGGNINSADGNLTIYNISAVDKICDSNGCIGESSGSDINGTDIEVGTINVTTNIYLANSTATTGEIIQDGTTVFSLRGDGNLFLGGAGQDITTGYDNVGIGDTLTFRHLDTGYQNFALGAVALQNCEGCAMNTVIGREAMKNSCVADTCNSNVAIGRSALYYTSGSANVCIGRNCMLHFANSGNTCVGTYCMDAGSNGNRIGTYNTAFGMHTMGNGGTDPDFNTVVGYIAGSEIDGDYNVHIGAYSGRFAEGSSNIFIGYYSGQDEDGSNKLLIDNQDRSSEGLSRQSSIIYGEMNSDANLQVLNVNALLNVTENIRSEQLQGSFSNGEAYLCVYNNGTIFAKDSACS